MAPLEVTGCSEAFTWAAVCRDPRIPGGLFWESSALCIKQGRGIPISVRSSPSAGPPCPTVQLLALLVHSAWTGTRRGFRPALWFQVAWVKWMDSSTTFTMVPDTNYCSIIVPTMDTIQMSYLLDLLLTNHKPVSAPATPASPRPRA